VKLAGPSSAVGLFTKGFRASRDRHLCCSAAPESAIVFLQQSARGPAPLPESFLTVLDFIGQAIAASRPTPLPAPCSAAVRDEPAPSRFEAGFPSSRRLQLASSSRLPTERCFSNFCAESLPSAGPAAGRMSVARPARWGVLRAGGVVRWGSFIGWRVVGVAACGSWGGGQGQPPGRPTADEERFGWGYRRLAAYSRRPQRCRWLVDQLQRPLAPRSGELDLLPSA